MPFTRFPGSCWHNAGTGADSKSCNVTTVPPGAGSALAVAGCMKPTTTVNTKYIALVVFAIQVTRVQGSQLCVSKAFTAELIFAIIGPIDMLVATTWSLFVSGVL